ncbi:MAG TPA: acetate--CoA ligase family protein, partial [Candidatus Limnocylindrales bacterium]|nr:acetate--CoA ligase family protein [Candidatus Limnocylindrales bacterium]
AEEGPKGRERQAALERLAAEQGLLICGPNCYGVLNVRLGSATFSADFAEPPHPGHVAVVSQSGGFSHAIAEQLMRQRAVGLSYIVSCGNQAGVTVEDYLEFLVADEDTQVIGVFVEGFRQPGKLRQVAALARERGKPIVALKVGRSENARQAMLAHTGSLAGTPEIIDAVLRQSGIVQVGSLNEMIDTLTLMGAAKDYRGRGWRVAVLSGLGGECGRVSDVAERVGIDLPPLSAASVDALRQFMPEFANPRNPLDGTGAMYENPTLFPRMIDVLLRDDTIDVVAVNFRANVVAPGGWAPSRQFSKDLGEALRGGTERLVVGFSSFAGGDLDQEVVRTLAEAGVPFLEGSETAMMALRHLREHRRLLDGAAAAPPPAPPARADEAAPGARRLLGNVEAMRLLSEFGIPVVETLAAKDVDEAVRSADRLGYPVVLKIDSPDIVHKTDVGGVRVGCADADSVRQAFHEMREEVGQRAPAARVDGVLVQRMIGGGTEMILGVKHDPTFGPAVICGFGGVFVEVMRDVSVRVPPLDAAEALTMVSELRGRALLDGARGRPRADLRALADALVGLARLADTHRERVRALDINPLLVLEEGRGVVAVDWLVELA